MDVTKAGATAQSFAPSTIEAVEVSVVIPHYQDLENLDQCLTLLQRQTIDRTRFEIIVADNASPVGLDAVRSVVGDRAHVVLSQEKGAGVTRNVGVAASTGRILAFIDSDCRPEPNFLFEGLAALGQFEIVGGAVRVDVTAPGQPTPSEAFELVFAFRNERYIREMNFSVTAALFVPRAIFDAVGPFRNDMSEDREWGNRAVAKGYKLGFAGKAIVGHPARRNWSEMERKWRRLTEETFMFSRNQPLGRLKWIVRNWAVLASTLPHMFRIAFSDRLKSPAQRIKAMGILVRLRIARFLWAHSVVLFGSLK